MESNFLSFDKSKILTIYGRNAVLEALEDKSIDIYRLHLSKSNRASNQLDKMKKIAQERGVEIKYHDKASLSRISKNSKQDQGVALDIKMKNFSTLKEFLDTNSSYKILVIDGVTTPQNVGMIIRSATAGDIDAIILPSKNTAKISPLVVKASVGTVFKIAIINSQDLAEDLNALLLNGANIYALDSRAKESLWSMTHSQKEVYILGNESEGISKISRELSTHSISIPMSRGVESLNVAVTASLIALCPKGRIDA